MKEECANPLRRIWRKEWDEHMKHPGHILTAGGGTPEGKMPLPQSPNQSYRKLETFCPEDGAEDV